MIKSLVVAAALTLGLSGYALAQTAGPGAPPPGMPMEHHVHHHHHYHHHHVYHHHHHHMAPPEAPHG